MVEQNETGHASSLQCSLQLRDAVAYMLLPVCVGNADMRCGSGAIVLSPIHCIMQALSLSADTFGGDGEEIRETSFEQTPLSLQD